MNLVAHAVVAAAEHDDPRYWLGAMLPDLVRMLGISDPELDDPVVQAGVAAHHAADASFHAHPAFLAACSRARTRLRAAGVPRPSAMAAAHVGVELLLDGALWSERTETLLRAAGSCHGAVGLRGSAQPRWIQLCEHLPALGAGYRDPTVVGERLFRILARRPRLAAGDDHRAALTAWARAAGPRIGREGPAWLPTRGGARPMTESA